MSREEKISNHGHPTKFYFQLQQVCNRAYAMEKLNKHFDLTKVLDTGNANE